MYLLFDIGGTHIRLAISKDHQNIDEIKTVPTVLDFDKVIEIITENALALSKNQEIEAVCGGSRGILDPQKNLISEKTILGWENKPLKKALTDIFDTKVYLENDAALAGLGEAVVGAGKGKNIVAFVTIASGVGGARIINGHIDINSLGFEPGHQILNSASNQLNILEDYIGGKGLEKKFNKRPEDILDEKVWDEVAKYLAIGLNNTIVHWSPDIVVLGGGVMRSIPIDRVKFHLNQILKIFPKLPEIVKAQLGDNAGLYGALEYLKQNLNT